MRSIMFIQMLLEYMVTVLVRDQICGPGSILLVLQFQTVWCTPPFCETIAQLAIKHPKDTFFMQTTGVCTA
jgi:hypothetical protein